VHRASLVGLALVTLLTLLPGASVAQAATAGGLTVRILGHRARVRTALGDLVPPERNVSQFGLELSAPTPWSALRVEGRMLRAGSGGADLQSTDVGLVASWRLIGISAAWGQRASYSPERGLAHGRLASFGRVGARVHLGFGDSGFVLHVRGDTYVPFDTPPDPEDAITGWDTESGVSYHFSRLPVIATLGYRLERFRIFRAEQEVSSLTFGIGYSIGGR
jgi:hypothetical protein